MTTLTRPELHQLMNTLQVSGWSRTRASATQVDALKRLGIDGRRLNTEAARVITETLTKRQHNGLATPRQLLMLTALGYPAKDVRHCTRRWADYTISRRTRYVQQPRGNGDGVNGKRYSVATAQAEHTPAPTRLSPPRLCSRMRRWGRSPKAPAKSLIMLGRPAPSHGHRTITVAAADAVGKAGA